MMKSYHVFRFLHPNYTNIRFHITRMNFTNFNECIVLKGYFLPDGKINPCDVTRSEKSRYQEEINEHTEQEKWEEDRFKSANQFNFGSTSTTKVFKYSLLHML